MRTFHLHLYTFPLTFRDDLDVSVAPNSVAKTVLMALIQRKKYRSCPDAVVQISPVSTEKDVEALKRSSGRRARCLLGSDFSHNLNLLPPVLLSTLKMTRRL